MEKHQTIKIADCSVIMINFKSLVEFYLLIWMF